jgi:hypothetical protein
VNAERIAEYDRRAKARATLRERAIAHARAQSPDTFPKVHRTDGGEPRLDPADLLAWVRAVELAAHELARDGALVDIGVKLPDQLAALRVRYDYAPFINSVLGFSANEFDSVIVVFEFVGTVLEDTGTPLRCPFGHPATGELGGCLPGSCGWR